ncbi:MAG: hypothetical protein ACLU6C_02040 [Streptococcus salivarius]
MGYRTANGHRVDMNPAVGSIACSQLESMERSYGTCAWFGKFMVSGNPREYNYDAGQAPEISQT